MKTVKTLPELHEDFTTEVEPILEKMKTFLSEDEIITLVNWYADVGSHRCLCESKEEEQ